MFKDICFIPLVLPPEGKMLPWENMPAVITSVVRHTKSTPPLTQANVCVARARDITGLGEGRRHPQDRE